MSNSKRARTLFVRKSSVVATEFALALMAAQIAYAQQPPDQAAPPQQPPAQAAPQQQPAAPATKIEMKASTRICMENSRFARLPRQAGGAAHHHRSGTP